MIAAVPDGTAAFYFRTGFQGPQIAAVWEPPSPLHARSFALAGGLPGNDPWKIRV